MATIQELAHQLGTEIAKQEAIIKYQAAAEAQEHDLELQKALMEYESMRNELVAKSQAGENVDELSEKLTAKQTAVMEMQPMKDFFEAREAAEALMNEVYGILNFYVTGEEAHECGGDCHSCGGCH